jgi:hypothetical protein
MTELTALFNEVEEKKETVKTSCKDGIFKKDKSTECKNAKGELKEAEKTFKKARENHFKKKLKQEKVPEGKLKNPPRQGGGALQSKISSRRKLKF